MDAFLDWEPDDDASLETFAEASSRFAPRGEKTPPSLPKRRIQIRRFREIAESRNPPILQRASSTKLRWRRNASPSAPRAVSRRGRAHVRERERLTPLGLTCAKLRGENELWLGLALSGEACSA